MPMDYTFRKVEFMSVRDKQLVLKGWVRFLKGGLRFADFTSRLYEHLHLNCSFIAHFSQSGFYATYFEHGEDTVKFLSQFDKRGDGQAVELGGSWWLEGGDCDDLNKAMVEEGVKFIPTLIEKAQAEQQDADVAHARALLAKHGLKSLD